MFCKRYVIYYLTFFFLLIAISIIFPIKQVFATYDPLSRPNNFFGIHILEPSEINNAATLVNSNGGDWGYVTIPIESGDRGTNKWQDFMNNARRLHLIPILRISTNPMTDNTNIWRKPNENDINDAANFLNSLVWPTKNRYVVIFNEPNRSNEWGGETPDPDAYAQLLNHAVDVFKSKNPDFFIIMAGLDAGAPSDGLNFLNSFIYLKKIMADYPTLFNKIDGFASHSYPNPGFSQPPDENKQVGIATYRYEYNLINSITSHKIPVFITETGWSRQQLSDKTIASFLSYANGNIWNKDKDKIVAITPFVFDARTGPFDVFSFLNDGQPTSVSATFQSFPKEKGEPELNIIAKKTKGINVLSIATRSSNIVHANNKTNVQKSGIRELIPRFVWFLEKLVEWV